MVAVNSFAKWVHFKLWNTAARVSCLQNTWHHDITVYTGKLLRPRHCKHIILKILCALFKVSQIFINLFNKTRIISDKLMLLIGVTHTFQLRALLALTCSKKRIFKMHFVLLFTTTHLPHKASVINPEEVKTLRPEQWTATNFSHFSYFCSINNVWKQWGKYVY